LAIHDEQLAEHGGREGIRDANLLESALMRPQNLAEYAKPTVPELAAAYALGILQSHPFFDGNKRTAAVVAELFLDLNGMQLHVNDAELVQMIEGCAGGIVSAAEFTAFFNRCAVRASE
jgi:death-on-curing protein